LIPSIWWLSYDSHIMSLIKSVPDVAIIFSYEVESLWHSKISDAFVPCCSLILYNNVCDPSLFRRMSWRKFPYFKPRCPTLHKD
jgi:hypothetical protein